MDTLDKIVNADFQSKNFNFDSTFAVITGFNFSGNNGVKSSARGNHF
ncbi:hypothetical protein [Sphingobacterium athyrii]|nr:hypothetical protein [Sphingobacterium athyrii]